MMQSSDDFIYGRRRHFDEEGNPVRINTKLGGREVQAILGHSVSGNVASKIFLQAGVYEFTARGDGHILSISPDALRRNNTGQSIVVEYIDPDRESESGFSEHVTRILGDLHHGVHIPGGVQVRLNVFGDTYLVDEHPSRHARTANKPEILDIIERTPFIAQGSSLFQYLEPGDYINSQPVDIKNSVDNNVRGSHDVDAQQWDYSLLAIKNNRLEDNSRVLIIVNSLGDDVVYLGPTPMKIEVLSGIGILRCSSLLEPDHIEFIDGIPSLVGETIQELKPGDSFSIGANTRVKYESTGLCPLILRDTTPGFRPEHEIATSTYFNGGSIFPRNGVTGQKEAVSLA